MKFLNRSRCIPNFCMNAGIVLASIALVSCGGGGGGSTTAAEGVWDGACQVDDDGDPSSFSFTVTGSTFSVDNTLYSRGTDCSAANAILVRSRSGTFTESAPIAVPARGDRYDVDIMTTEYSITPLSVDGAEAANTVMLCDKTDWENNVTSVQNTCDIFSSGRLPPYAEYDTYLVSNGDLFFSAAGSSFDIESRPVTLSDTPQFSQRGGTTAEPPGTTGGDGSGNPLSAALQGSWLDTCDFDSEGGSITTFTFDGSRITILGNEHDDAACNEPVVNIMSEGTFVLSNPVETDRGTQSDIDITFDTFTFELLTEAGAAQFGAAALCGRTDWDMNVVYDISDCDDLVGPEERATIYDIVLVEGNEFFGGIGDPGETPEDRPTRASAVATAEKI